MQENIGKCLEILVYAYLINVIVDVLYKLTLVAIHLNSGS